MKILLEGLIIIQKWYLNSIIRVRKVLTMAQLMLVDIILIL